MKPIKGNPFKTLLLALVFCVLVVVSDALAGSVLSNIIKDLKKLERKEYPLFLADSDTNAIVLAYLYAPSATWDDSNIEFYRLIQYNKGFITEFNDFSKTGLLLRKGNVAARVDTVYTFAVNEFNTKSKTNVPVVEASYESTVSLSGYYLPKDFSANGYIRRFYPNGKLREEFFYKNGLLSDGTHRVFHPNGILHLSYTIKNKALNDTVFNYDDSGKLLSFHIFSEGTLLKEKSYEEKKLPAKNKKALIVAIGDYTEATGMFDINIKYDIYFIKKMLAHHGFPEENIRLLQDSTATLVGIVKALKELENSVVQGDVVYIHFSTHTTTDAVIPYDYIKKTKTGLFSNDMLLDYVNRIRVFTGASGQVMLTYDTGMGFGDVDLSSDTTSGSTPVTGFRSAVANTLQKSGDDRGSFIALYPQNMGFEIKVNDTITVGAISYYLYRTLTELPLDGFRHLEAFIFKMAEQQSNKTRISIVGQTDMPLFESRPELAVKTTELKADGHAWILSIGISDYNTGGNNNLSFSNCPTDAINVARHFETSFGRINRNTDTPYKQWTKILIDSTATRDSILSAINTIISSAAPNDYFIFNFSGYTTMLHDKNGEPATWFMPYGKGDIFDSVYITQNAIPLRQFRDLFQFIPANNQLFITEAGQTADFQKEFIKALIESNPTIAAISGKNRIIMVPEGPGMDYFTCRYERINGGPLSWFITSLPASVNIFQLFEPGENRRRAEYALHHIETACNTFSKAYTRIFFEDEFIKDLKYYLPDNLMNTRGAGLFDELPDAPGKGISQRYALIIGTDTYKNAPRQWGALANPVADARAVAEELRTGFGYDVRLLIDPPLDTIYKALISYSSILDSNAQFLLFVAGHGDFDNVLDDGMIVCNDSRYAAEDRARNSYIPYSKLTRIINRLPSRQILVLLDVCFGGTFDEQVARNKNRSKSDMYEAMAADEFTGRKLQYITRLYITSGGKKEVPDGYRGKHSPFAYKILEALRGRGGSYGALTSSDLYQFVKKLPSEPLIGSFGDDEPGSEFILIALEKLLAGGSD